MRRVALFGLVAAGVCTFAAAVSCGGQTGSTAVRPGTVGDASADGSSFTSPGSGALRDASPRGSEDGHDSFVAHAPTDAGPPDAAEAGPRSDAAHDPDATACRAASGMACSGDTLLHCDGTYPPLDCATYFLSSTHPLVATCARTSEGAGCVVPPHGACWTSKDGDALLIRCLGESASCVVHADDTSECVEHLPRCVGWEAIDECVGTFRVPACLDGQPFAEDCRDYSPQATCASTGGRTHCENVGLGGSCDTDADAAPDVDTRIARCAPGFTCVGAVDGVGRPAMGSCQGPPEDPCASASRTACEGSVLWTCEGGVRASVDCDGRYVLNAERPILATCAKVGGAATCVTHVYEPCTTEEDGAPLTLGCLGDRAGCVIRGSDGECTEWVGTCQGTGTDATPRCFGRKRLVSCQHGQPVVFDCETHTTGGGTCGSDATSSWCENLQEYGGCDSNADGSTTVGSSTYRCAPGLSCVGATDVDGELVMGQCRVP